MQRKEKSELTILRVDKNCQYMEYEKLREIFLRDLTQYFYLTDEDDRLFGILSVGDVKKRQDGKVFFNRNFSKVCGWNRIKAKKIFDDKPAILEIPVVDKNDRIIGAYARKDEICEIEYYKDIIILRGGVYRQPLCNCSSLCILWFQIWRAAHQKILLREIALPASSIRDWGQIWRAAY